MVDRTLGWLFVVFIHAYRQFLSPVKGFSYPHNLMHNLGSCSHCGLHAFQHHNLVKGWRKLHPRLFECRLARIQLNEEIVSRNSQTKPKWYDFLNGCDCSALDCSW